MNANESRIKGIFLWKEIMITIEVGTDDVLLY